MRLRLDSGQNTTDLEKLMRRLRDFRVSKKDLKTGPTVGKNFVLTASKVSSRMVAKKVFQNIVQSNGEEESTEVVALRDSDWHGYTFQIRSFGRQAEIDYIVHPRRVSVGVDKPLGQGLEIDFLNCCPSICSQNVVVGFLYI